MTENLVKTTTAAMLQLDGGIYLRLVEPSASFDSFASATFYSWRIDGWALLTTFETCVALQKLYEGREVA